MFVDVIKLSENIMLLLPHGWLQRHQFMLGFTQRSEDKKQFFVSSVTKEMRKCSKTETVSNIEIKTNQSTKQTNQCRSQKIEKLINYFSITNSLIVSCYTAPNTIDGFLSFI